MEDDEEDTSALMQGSIFRASTGEVSTFAVHVQTMTDQLGNLDAERQRARVRVLQALLRERYGSGPGRSGMLERAQSVEAMASPLEVV